MCRFIYVPINEICLLYMCQEWIDVFFRYIITKWTVVFFIVCTKGSVPSKKGLLTSIYSLEFMFYKYIERSSRWRFSKIVGSKFL